MPKIVKPVMQEIRSKPLTYIVQFVGLLVVIANLWLVSKLAPLEQNITVMAEKINDIQHQLNDVEDQHMNFVEKDTFDGLVERINHISTRVDAIYSIVSRRD